MNCRLKACVHFKFQNESRYGTAQRIQRCMIVIRRPSVIRYSLSRPKLQTHVRSIVPRLSCIDPLVGYPEVRSQLPIQYLHLHQDAFNQNQTIIQVTPILNVQAHPVKRCKVFDIRYRYMFLTEQHARYHLKIPTHGLTYSALGNVLPIASSPARRSLHPSPTRQTYQLDIHKRHRLVRHTGSTTCAVEGACVTHCA